MIMEGNVFVNNNREDKAGSTFPDDCNIEIHGKTLQYVSRGGLKLEKAMKHFDITMDGKVCMDIGASTGGFTDCMLQNGAKKVYAVDVGYGQFAWKLRQDERGYAGGAAIDGPVKLVCGAGRYTVGDWCRNDALRTYSGAAWYGRDFTLTKKPAGRVTLDLGEVVSTARVLVNGREAGLRLTPPWRFDVTGLLQDGANRIEIRVCNTTANIFLSSPTVYRGDTKAGILGPVRIEIAE